jgi:Arc/MetJ family transcription regulator
MRITVDIDDEALAAAAAVLGTSTKVDTVNGALAEIAARPRRVAALERLRTATDDLGDAGTMQRAWR